MWLLCGTVSLRGSDVLLVSVLELSSLPSLSPLLLLLSVSVLASLAWSLQLRLVLLPPLLVGGDGVAVVTNWEVLASSIVL